MFDRGPDLLIRILVGALGGALALSAAMAPNPGFPLKVGEIGNARYAADALSTLIAVSFVGDGRLKAAVTRFISEERLAVHGALRVLAKIWRRHPRVATSVFRIRNRSFGN